MTQYFKGDELEIKFFESAKQIFDDLSLQKDLFLDDAYDCQAFGDIIYNNNLSPLANAINSLVFRESFNEVFSQFELSGSFESYIEVFKKVFGDDVGITFTVPSEGRLQIDIEAEDVILFDAVARRIVSDAYVFDEIIDYENDNLAFQSLKGFQTQYELEQMLFELVPNGIFTEITLSLGA